MKTFHHLSSYFILFILKFWQFPSECVLLGHRHIHSRSYSFFPFMFFIFNIHYCYKVWCYFMRYFTVYSVIVIFIFFSFSTKKSLKLDVWNSFKNFLDNVTFHVTWECNVLIGRYFINFERFWKFYWNNNIKRYNKYKVYRFLIIWSLQIFYRFTYFSRIIIWLIWDWNLSMT